MTKQKLISKSVIFIAIVLLLIIPLGFNAFVKDSKSDNTKILLIGIDGLEWSIVRELTKDGRMPTFAELIKNGACGNLRTFLDYSSPGLWTTIATGKMPEVHGITSHLVHEEGSYGLVSPKSYHRKTKALWNILTEQKKKVGVINYLCTEPPEAVNGFIIPYSITDFKDVFPSSLDEEINLVSKTFAETAREFFNDFRPYCNYQDELSRGISEHLVDREVWRISVITPYLYQKFNKSLDLLICYVSETDYISHIFWKFMRPEFFQHKSWGLTLENTKRFSNVIKDMYVMVDKFVKRLIENVADENTVIIICSDHGFRSSSHRQRDGTIVPEVIFKDLNKLLEKLGYLQYKTDDKSKTYKNWIKSLIHSNSSINFNKTLAYHNQIGGPEDFPDVFISLNLKGRQSNGVIESDQEYTTLKKELIDALLNLRIVESGESLFEDVTDSTLEQTDIKITVKTDVDLPEQHVEINGDVYPLSNFCVLLDTSGDHSDPGVLIIYGNKIRKEKLITGSSVLDIAPTILYLLGLPVAKDMEGDVLTEAVDAGFLRRNPVKYINTYENKGKLIRKESNPRLIDEQELEKLRSLGYVH